MPIRDIISYHSQIVRHPKHTSLTFLHDFCFHQKPIPLIFLGILGYNIIQLRLNFKNDTIMFIFYQAIAKISQDFCNPNFHAII